MLGILTRWKNTREKRRLRKTKEKLPARSPISQETALLETVIPALTNREIQYIIRDAVPLTLAIALTGASGEIILRFLDNLPDRGQILLLEEIHYCTSTNREIHEAQEKLLTLIGN